MGGKTWKKLGNGSYRAFVFKGDERGTLYFYPRTKEWSLYAPKGRADGLCKELTLDLQLEESLGAAGEHGWAIPS